MSDKTYGGTKKKKKKDIPPSRVNTAVRGAVDRVRGAVKKQAGRTAESYRTFMTTGEASKPTPLRMHGTTRPARSITNPTVPYDLIPRGPSIRETTISRDRDQALLEAGQVTARRAMPTGVGPSIQRTTKKKKKPTTADRYRDR